MTPEIAPVLAEIEAILKENDMVGFVLVSTAEKADWLMQMEASWSCAKMEGDVLRMRCKASEIPDVKERQRLVTGAVGSITVMMDAMRKLYENLCRVLEMIHRNGIDIGGYNKTID